LTEEHWTNAQPDKAKSGVELFERLGSSIPNCENTSLTFNPRVPFSTTNFAEQTAWRLVVSD
jgi:hypothetical protein